jgi:hypothetical protein
MSFGSSDSDKKKEEKLKERQEAMDKHGKAIHQYGKWHVEIIGESMRGKRGGGTLLSSKGTSLVVQAKNQIAAVREGIEGSNGLLWKKQMDKKKAKQFKEEVALKLQAFDDEHTIILKQHLGATGVMIAAEENITPYSRGKAVSVQHQARARKEQQTQIQERMRATAAQPMTLSQKMRPWEALTGGGIPYPVDSVRPQLHEGLDREKRAKKEGLRRRQREDVQKARQRDHERMVAMLEQQQEARWRRQQQKQQQKLTSKSTSSMMATAPMRMQGHGRSGSRSESETPTSMHSMSPSRLSGGVGSAMGHTLNITSGTQLGSTSMARKEERFLQNYALSETTVGRLLFGPSSRLLKGLTRASQLFTGAGTQFNAFWHAVNTNNISATAEGLEHDDLHRHQHLQEHKKFKSITVKQLTDFIIRIDAVDPTKFNGFFKGITLPQQTRSAIRYYFKCPSPARAEAAANGVAAVAGKNSNASGLPGDCLVKGEVGEVMKYIWLFHQLWPALQHVQAAEQKKREQQLRHRHSPSSVQQAAAEEAMGGSNSVSTPSSVSCTPSSPMKKRDNVLIDFQCPMGLRQIFVILQRLGAKVMMQVTGSGSEMSGMGKMMEELQAHAANNADLQAGLHGLHKQTRRLSMSMSMSKHGHGSNSPGHESELSQQLAQSMGGNHGGQIDRHQVSVQQFVNFFMQLADEEVAKTASVDARVGINRQRWRRASLQAKPVTLGEEMLGGFEFHDRDRTIELLERAATASAAVLFPSSRGLPDFIARPRRKQGGMLSGASMSASGAPGSPIGSKGDAASAAAAAAAGGASKQGVGLAFRAAGHMSQHGMQEWAVRVIQRTWRAFHMHQWQRGFALISHSISRSLKQDEERRRIKKEGLLLASKLFGQKNRSANRSGVDNDEDDEQTKGKPAPSPSSPRALREALSELGVRPSRRSFSSWCHQQWWEGGRTHSADAAAVALAAARSARATAVRALRVAAAC